MNRKESIIFIIISLCIANDILAGKAYIGSNANSTIAILDTTTNIITGKVKDPNSLIPHVGFIAVTPDGKTAYASAYPGTSDIIVIIDVATDTAIGTITIPSTTHIHSMTINSDGTLMYVMVSGVANVFIVDITQNQVIGSIDATFSPFTFPSYMAITPDGITAYVTNAVTFTPSVSIITLADEAVSGNITDGSIKQPQYIAMSPDGMVFYVANTPSGDTVNIIKTATNEVTDTISGFSDPLGMALSPNGNTLYVNNTANGTVSVLNTATKTMIYIPVSAINQTKNIGLTPDGTTLYALNYSNSVIPIINTTTNSKSGEVNDPNTIISNPSTIAFVPNPQVPSSASGTQIQNIFLTQTELVNILTWQAPAAPSTTPVSYTIYRDASLTDRAGTVSADGPLTFQDHDRSAGVTYTYYIVATDQYGSMSQPAIATVNPL